MWPAPPYDRGGKIAARGQVNTALLDELMADAYYKRKPPKSAGREQYGEQFFARLKQTGLPNEDLVTTATVLTAATIARAVLPFGAADLIASGGGVHNPADHGTPSWISPRSGALHFQRSRR